MFGLFDNKPKPTTKKPKKDILARHLDRDLGGLLVSPGQKTPTKNNLYTNRYTDLNEGMSNQKNKSRELTEAGISSTYIDKKFGEYLLRFNNEKMNTSQAAQKLLDMERKLNYPIFEHEISPRLNPEMKRGIKTMYGNDYRKLLNDIANPTYNAKRVKLLMTRIKSSNVSARHQRTILDGLQKEIKYYFEKTHQPEDRPEKPIRIIKGMYNPDDWK